MSHAKSHWLTKPAARFVLLIGVVSLFADMTYEGARSITGSYLAVLGATGTTVGIVAGAGELFGYVLRLFSGWLAQRTQRYWLLTFFGYALNMLAVPLLAFAGRWEIAAVLIVAERAGKAIRTPPRDVMLSHATETIGHGRGFGLHEMLDQIGATTGPIIVAIALMLHVGYANSFAILAIPAVLALACLTAARLWYPRPQELNPNYDDALAKSSTEKLSQHFWIYVGATGLLAAGYADFPLIAFHLEKSAHVARQWIPFGYAYAMGVDAIAAYVLGVWFDRIGLRSLMGAVFLSAAFAPFAFSNDLVFVGVGLTLWGIGMGAQDSVLRAALIAFVPTHKRASAFGIFNACFGVSWFLGSVAMGYCYDVSLHALIIVSIALQLAAIPLLAWLYAQRKRQP